MTENILRPDEDNKTEGCDCCGSEVPTGLFEPPFHWKNKEKLHLCEVCSRTLISSAYTYPEQHYEDGHLLVCLAACTNMILEAIRGSQK